MKLESLKDLESVMKLCKKHGVESIEVDGVRMKLVDTQTSASSGSSDIKVEDPYANLTDEDILEWSSRGITNG